MTTPQEALKPCPFCGSAASSALNGIDDEVYCSNDACFAHDFMCIRPDEWNRRADSAQQAAPAVAQQIDCTEPDRSNCPRMCHDFCNKIETERAAAQAAPAVAPISDADILALAADHHLPVRFPHETVAFARALLAKVQP